MGFDTLLLFGSKHTRFVLQSALGTFDSKKEVAAYTLGFEEGLLLMREHPLVAGKILNEFLTDQIQRDPQAVETLINSCEVFNRGGLDDL